MEETVEDRPSWAKIRPQNGERSRPPQNTKEAVENNETISIQVAK